LRVDNGTFWAFVVWPFTKTASYHGGIAIHTHIWIYLLVAAMSIPFDVPSVRHTKLLGLTQLIAKGKSSEITMVTLYSW
jgi:hypothetical protein